MNKMLYTFIFIFLTVLTQVGGVIFLLSLWIAKKSRLNTIAIFLPLYLVATFLLIPHLAPLLGREPIRHTTNLSENMIFQEWILRLLRDISLAVFISLVIPFSFLLGLFLSKRKEGKNEQ